MKNQNASTLISMMILLIIYWFHCVLTQSQPLQIDQYNALMSIYDALGEVTLCDLALHNFFLF